MYLYFVCVSSLFAVAMHSNGSYAASVIFTVSINVSQMLNVQQSANFCL